MYWFVYVDDIIIIDGYVRKVEILIATILRHFVVKNLGDLGFFLGVVVSRSSTYLRLSKKQYITIGILT